MATWRVLSVAGVTAVLAAGLVSGCGSEDSETTSPDGGAVTVPDPSKTTPEEPEPEETGAEEVEPDVEGIGIDEATQIAIDEFGGVLDSVESDDHDGIPVWEVELDDTDLGMDLEIMVDKDTGEILHYEED